VGVAALQNAAGQQAAELMDVRRVMSAAVGLKESSYIGERRRLASGMLAWPVLRAARVLLLLK
jgi:hypothetical protein